MLGIWKWGLVVGALVVVSGCGGGYASSPHTTAQVPKQLATASVPGVGKVLVDNGRTVYILTKPGEKNVPCTAASGCTSAWPPVSQTFDGWRVYEYTGDSGSGQANGEGLKSFGGTWYALRPSGRPVKQSSSGGGYRYP
jgi:hypothetical protein